jgi:hypothetical protein
LLHFAGELGGGAFVGVEEEDPGVFEGDGGEGSVAVGGVVVEGADVGVGAGGFGDLEGGVGALGVEDVDVVGPGDAGEAAGEVALLVAGEDEDGDHLLAMVSRVWSMWLGWVHPITGAQWWRNMLGVAVGSREGVGYG